MGDIMLMWGSYAFGIDSAAYQELQRTKGWKWASHELYGRAPKLQFTGEEEETINLQGVIYPHWRGGTGQLDDMRALADKAEPQTLLDGRGNILGLYVATSIGETQQVFDRFGIPRKQEFSIALKYFPDPNAITGNIGIAALKKAGVDPSAALNAIKKIQSAISQVKAAISAAKAIAQGVQGVIGAPFAMINSAAKVAENVAGDFKRLADDANNIATAPVTTAAQAVASTKAAVQMIVEGTPTLTAQARQAGESLKTSLETVVDLGVAPAGVIATRAVMVAANKQSNLISNSYHNFRALKVEEPSS